MDIEMISVIIPLYNAAPWMARSVDSVMRQTYHNWELLLVDDGSKDSTWNKCRAYAAKDKRIHVLHQENKGVTVARYNGLKHSNGDYVCFLDADDALNKNALEILICYANKYSADVVKCTEQIIGKKERTLQKNHVIGIMDAEEYMNAVYFTKIISTLHASIYKRSVLSDDIFNIDKRYKLGEDIAMNVLIANNVSSAFVSNDLIYDYYCNADSAMQTQVMSYEYNKEIGEFIYNSVTHKSQSIVNEYKDVNRQLSLILKFFFIPEISFSDERYYLLREYLQDKSTKDKLYAKVDRRYLRFVDCGFLYKAYTFIYRMLYLFLHQKGKKRKVIY